MLRINVCRPAVVVAAVVVLFSCANDSSAVLVFSDDFEGNAVGANPAGWSLYNDLPGAIGDIGVATGTPTGGSGSKVLGITKTATVGDSFGILNNHTDTTENVATLSFKVKFSGETDFRIEADGGGGAKTYLRMLPTFTTGGSAGFSVNEFGNGTSSLQNITIDHWYQVVQSFDFTGSTWDISIDDLDDVAAPNVTTGLKFFGAAVPTKLSLANITSLSATRLQNAQLDDFIVSEFAAVPEPSAFAFGSLVVMLVGMAKARRRIA